MRAKFEASGQKKDKCTFQINEYELMAVKKLSECASFCVIEVFIYVGEFFRQSFL